jgi:hypothetical protein
MHEGETRLFADHNNTRVPDITVKYHLRSSVRRSPWSTSSQQRSSCLRIAATELALIRTEENERNPPRKVIAHYNILQADQVGCHATTASADVVENLSMVGKSSRRVFPAAPGPLTRQKIASNAQ